MSPVSVVLIIDSSDLDSLSSENIFHRLSGDHRQLHELDGFVARKLRSIFHRYLGVYDQMSAITAGYVRMFRRDDLEMF